MVYVWDSAKAQRNLRVHGISFVDAVKVFDGPTLETIDDRFDYGETRIRAIGVVNGIELTVICTDVADGERRIISAWRSERHERKAYWQSFK